MLWSMYYIRRHLNVDNPGWSWLDFEIFKLGIASLLMPFHAYKPIGQGRSDIMLDDKLTPAEDEAVPQLDGGEGEAGLHLQEQVQS